MPHKSKRSSRYWTTNRHVKEVASGVSLTLVAVSDARVDRSADRIAVHRVRPFAPFLLMAQMEEGWMEGA